MPALLALTDSATGQIGRVARKRSRASEVRVGLNERLRGGRASSGFVAPRRPRAGIRPVPAGDDRVGSPRHAARLSGSKQRNGRRKRVRNRRRNNRRRFGNRCSVIVMDAAAPIPATRTVEGSHSKWCYVSTLVSFECVSNRMVSPVLISGRIVGSTSLNWRSVTGSLTMRQRPGRWRARRRTQ